MEAAIMEEQAEFEYTTSLEGMDVRTIKHSGTQCRITPDETGEGAFTFKEGDEVGLLGSEQGSVVWVITPDKFKCWVPKAALIGGR